MFSLDIPLVPPPELPTIMAGVLVATNQATVDTLPAGIPPSTVDSGYDKTAHVCNEVIGPNTKYTPKPESLSSRNILRPEFEAIYSFVPDPSSVAGGSLYERMMKGVEISVVQQPKYGKLLPVQVGEHKGFFYMADEGFFGRDKTVFGITYANGKRILLTNEVSVVGTPSQYGHTVPCTETPADYKWMRDHLPEIKKVWEEMNESANKPWSVPKNISWANRI